jgi:hypothetical protein
LTQEYHVALARPVVPEDSESLHLEIMRRRLESIRTHAGAETVVIKNTASCGRIPILARFFPHAGFAHVIRHPAQVVMSLLRTGFWQEMVLWWDGRTVRQYALQEGLTQEEVAAQHWSRQVGSAYKELAAQARNRSVVMRYDKFVVRPLESLMLLEAVGVRVADSPLVRQRIDALRIQAPRPRSQAPRAVSLAVEKHCADVAAGIGLHL